MGLATHIVVSKVHFWVIWEAGKFGLKKGTGVDPPPPRADNVPFFYRFFKRRASLRAEFEKKYHLSYMQPAKIEDELEDGEHLFKIKAATAIEHNWAIEHLRGNKLTGT